MTHFIKPKAEFTSNLPRKGMDGGGPKKEPSFLQVGRHTVKVAEVSPATPNKTDKTWLDLNLTLTNDAGKKTWGDVSIPTESDEFTTSKGEVVAGPAYKAMSFLGAMGGNNELSSDNIRKTVGDLRKLIGRTLEVEVGYRNAFITFEAGVFKVVVKGVIQKPEFANRDLAEIYLKQNNIRYDKFPKVTKFFASSAPKAKVVVDDLY